MLRKTTKSSIDWLLHNLFLRRFSASLNLPCFVVKIVLSFPDSSETLSRFWNCKHIAENVLDICRRTRGCFYYHGSLPLLSSNFAHLNFTSSNAQPAESLEKRSLGFIFFPAKIRIICFSNSSGPQFNHNQLFELSTWWIELGFVNTLPVFRSSIAVVLVSGSIISKLIMRGNLKPIVGGARKISIYRLKYVGKLDIRESPFRVYSKSVYLMIK